LVESRRLGKAPVESGLRAALDVFRPGQRAAGNRGNARPDSTNFGQQIPSVHAG
jgi:hypothetical protein